MSNLDPHKPKVRQHTGILNSKKKQFKPMSFRLDFEDDSLISFYLKKMNALSKRKVTKTDVIKGLLRAGMNIDVKLIFEGVKDSM